MKERICLITILMIVVGSLAATIIYVPDDYTTIDSAINAANANDAIIVRDGTYYLNSSTIYINDWGLMLRSENGADNCIFNLSGMPSGPNFNIIARNVKIEGITFINSHEHVIVNNGMETVITRCKFFNNTYESVIESYSPLGELSYCVFENNTSNHTVDIYADYVVGQDPVVNEIIKNNQFIDNDCYYNGDLKIINSSMNYTGLITNNTFANSTNRYAIDSFENLIVTNCIFYNADVLYTSNVNFSYNSFSNAGYSSNSNWGDGNLVNNDPLFVNIGNDDCSLKWNTTAKSPCIDAGEPTILDSDGTPSDMGAIRAINHEYHTTTASSGRYRWVSFPVLDRIYTSQGFNTTYVCQAVEDQVDYFKIFDEDDNKQIYDIPDWTNTNLSDLDSKIGYKIQTFDDVDIPTSGLTLPENTLVELDAGENWVGYFVQNTLPINVAFADIWDHIQSIYGEDWAWKKGDTIPSSRCGLIYGKMYRVYVDQACSFRYNHNGIPIKGKEREMTDGFSYTETPDYAAVNIVDFDQPDVTEIGVLLDGECIGASKVEDELVQILAFTPQDYDGTGEITFQLYSGGRSYKEVDSYQVLGNRNSEKLKLASNEFSNIRFGKSEELLEIDAISNYPNPFNPTTTISFSIANKPSLCTVEIYNTKGQKVKTLINEKLSTGSHSVIWNGTDDNSNKVSSGIYFYKIKSAEINVTKKMLMLK